eukprot:GHVL01035084.1.p1 GENE.GHVL01035084.1~~GHVL01035084.1.p1  ORF type:complete len:495 (-),score=75.41 GHVL01035084.1:366-1850(-)
MESYIDRVVNMCSDKYLLFITTLAGYRILHCKKSSKPHSIVEISRTDMSHPLSLVVNFKLTNMSAHAGSRCDGDGVVCFNEKQMCSETECHFNNTTVYIWDSLAEKYYAEFQHKSIYIYDGNKAKLKHLVDSISNPRGIGVVIADYLNNEHVWTLICPGQQIGTVRVEWQSPQGSRTIEAHESPLTAIAATESGDRFVTASEHGTLINVWAIINNESEQSVERIVQFRIGTSKQQISSIVWRQDGVFLAASTELKLVYVFKMPAPGDVTSPGTLQPSPTFSMSSQSSFHESSPTRGDGRGEQRRWEESADGRWDGSADGSGDKRVERNEFSDPQGSPPLNESDRGNIRSFLPKGGGVSLLNNLKSNYLPSLERTTQFVMQNYVGFTMGALAPHSIFKIPKADIYMRDIRAENSSLRGAICNFCYRDNNCNNQLHVYHPNGIVYSLQFDENFPGDLKLLSSDVYFVSNIVHKTDRADHVEAATLQKTEEDDWTIL